MDLFPVLGTVTHMGRFTQDGNFTCFVSLFKNFDAPLWPNLYKYWCTLQYLHEVWCSAVQSSELVVL